MAAPATPKVRLNAGMLGQHSKVEVFVDDEWRDITNLCSSANVDVSVGNVTTITLTLAFTEITAEGVFDEATLALLERVVKGHRTAAA